MDIIAEPQAQMDTMALIPLAIIGLIIVLGAIAGVCMLLANEKTRTAGFVVLALGFGVLVCGGGSLLLLTQRESQSVESAYEVQAFRETPMRSRPAEPSGFLETPTPSTPAVDGAEEDTPAAEPNPRPAWVAKPPTYREIQPDGPRDAHDEPASVEKVYQVAATVGPYTSRMECDANMTADLQKEVARYVETILGREASRHVRLSDHYIQQNLIKAQWEEPVDASFGPMVQLHVLLQFDRETRERVEKLWHDYQVQQRLWYAGGGLAAVLLLLLVVFGFLKSDWSLPGRAIVGTMVAVFLGIGVAVVVMGLVWMSHDQPVASPVIKAMPEQPDRVELPREPAGPDLSKDAHRIENAMARAVSPGRPMATPQKAFVGVGVLALLLVGGLGMLISPKTRPFGYALLGLLAVLLCVFMLGVA